MDMGTRLPPSHAPAWGRRRQEGEARTDPTPGNNGNGNAVGQVRRAEAEALVERTAEAKPDDAEQRNRQRRIDDEAYRALVDQRARESRTQRKNFDHQQFVRREERLDREDVRRERRDVRDPRDAREPRELRELRDVREPRSPARLEDARSPRQREPAGDRRDGDREGPRDARTHGSPSGSPASSSRADIARALGGIEKAAAYLTRGMGAEAAVTLAKESREARSAARQMERRTPEERMLGALATNMGVRAQALRTATPDRAERVAHRMEQIARGTERRAEALERGGLVRDAKALRNVATDSRIQASLVRAGASNTEALFGRAIARVLSGLSRVDTPGANPKLDHALKQLDRSIERQRTSFHDALRPGDRPADRASDPARRDRADDHRAVGVLKKNDRTKDLLVPLGDLSAAVSRGDPRGAVKARSDLIDLLLSAGRMPELEAVLRKLPPARGTTDPKVLLEQLLPRLLLDGLKNGGIRDLATSEGIARWLSKMPAPSDRSRELLPGERALFAKGNVTPQGLGPIESLLLGSPALFDAQGTVSSLLAKHGLEGITPFGSLLEGTPLTPVGREKAVLVGLDGRVLVRGEEGAMLYDGHAIGANEERYYYDRAQEEELERVVYRRARDPSELHIRIDLPVEAVGEEETEERRGRHDAEEGDAPENLALVCIVAGDTVMVQGLTTRHAARLAGDEIDRTNGRLPREERIGHVFVEHATDAGARLDALGLRGSTSQAAIDAELARLDLAPASVAVLVLFAREAATSGGSMFIQGDRAVPCDTADRYREPCLIGDGVVLHASSVVID
jgi:hypothetical protein